MWGELLGQEAVSRGDALGGQVNSRVSPLGQVGGSSWAMDGPRPAGSPGQGPSPLMRQACCSEIPAQSTPPRVAGAWGALREVNQEWLWGRGLCPPAGGRSDPQLKKPREPSTGDSKAARVMSLGNPQMHAPFQAAE